MSVEKLQKSMSAKILAISGSTSQKKDCETESKDRDVSHIERCNQQIQNVNSTWESKLTKSNRMANFFQKEIEFKNATIKDLENKLEKKQQMLAAEKTNMVSLLARGKSNETRLLGLLFEKDNKIIDLDAKNSKSAKDISDLKDRVNAKDRFISTMRKDHREYIKNLNDTCQREKVSMNKLLEEQLDRTKNYLEQEKNITIRLRKDLDKEIRTHSNTTRQLELLDRALNQTEKDVNVLIKVYISCLFYFLIIVIIISL